MDAITLIKADHRAVEDLLRQIKELDESAHDQRRELFRQIDTELTVHSEFASFRLEHSIVSREPATILEPHRFDVGLGHAEVN